MKKRRRLKPNIANSRWLAYASAGAASALGFTPSVEAEIHHSGRVNVVFRGDATVFRSFQLAYPGASFELVHYAANGHAAFTIIGDIRGAQYPYASRLKAGDNISASPFAGGYVGFLVKSVNAPFGQWKHPGIGFVGFSFYNSRLHGTQYGWARLRMRGNKNNNGFTLLDYAWADPGESIRAGQTSSETVNAAEEGSLGLLALGAAGLIAWREKRNAARSQ